MDDRDERSAAARRGESGSPVRWMWRWMVWECMQGQCERLSRLAVWLSV